MAAQISRDRCMQEKAACLSKAALSGYL